LTKRELLQALVARLDDEVEAKSMLQSKLAALEIAGSAIALAGSVTTLAAPGSAWVSADVGGAENVSLILANFETERKVFEETRKVRDLKRVGRFVARSEHASDALYLKADVVLRLVEVLVVGTKCSADLANLRSDVLCCFRYR